MTIKIMVLNVTSAKVGTFGAVKNIYSAQGQ
jgi:hypothetical protein